MSATFNSVALMSLMYLVTIMNFCTFLLVYRNCTFLFFSNTQLFPKSQNLRTNFFCVSCNLEISTWPFPATRSLILIVAISENRVRVHTCTNIAKLLSGYIKFVKNYFLKALASLVGVLCLAYFSFIGIKVLKLKTNFSFEPPLGVRVHASVYSG